MRKEKERRVGSTNLSSFQLITCRRLVMRHLHRIQTHNVWRLDATPRAVKELIPDKLGRRMGYEDRKKKKRENVCNGREK